MAGPAVRAHLHRVMPVAGSLLVGSVAGVLAATLGATPVHAVTTLPPQPGADVSWPQCRKGLGRGLGLPMPVRPSRFVLIGINEGSSGFTRNPCLRAQVRWARRGRLWVGAYTVAGHPTRQQVATYGSIGPYAQTTVRGQLANTGAAQARATIAAMRTVGLGRTPMVWVDVENPPLQPWSRDPTRNVAVLAGMLGAYRRHGYRVGIYSYPYGWHQITGGLRTGLPVWIASGQGNPAGALSRCTPRGFTGGPVLISQWWTTLAGHGVDYDLTCPQALSDQAAVSANLPTMFTRPQLVLARPFPSRHPAPRGLG